MRYRNQYLPESSQVFLVAPARAHREVNRSSYSFTHSGFLHASCPGIEGIFVGGKVKDFGVGIEGILSPVSVMDIKVGDKDSTEIKPTEGKLGGDRHIVENAEAHCSISNGVVTRRSD